jgi:hypothetical protein
MMNEKNKTKHTHSFISGRNVAIAKTKDKQ